MLGGSGRAAPSNPGRDSVTAGCPKDGRSTRLVPKASMSARLISSSCPEKRAFVEDRTHGASDVAVAVPQERVGVVRQRRVDLADERVDRLGLEGVGAHVDRRRGLRGGLLALLRDLLGDLLGRPGFACASPPRSAWIWRSISAKSTSGAGSCPWSMRSLSAGLRRLSTESGELRESGMRARMRPCPRTRFSSRRLAMCPSADSYSDAISANLAKAGSNRSEIERFLARYDGSADPQKRDAARWLVANMDGHGYTVIELAAADGTLLPFDALDHKTLADAKKAYDAIERTHPGCDFRRVRFDGDLEHASADFLSAHLDQAFDAWRTHAVGEVDQVRGLPRVHPAVPRQQRAARPLARAGARAPGRICAGRAPGRPMCARSARRSAPSSTRWTGFSDLFYMHPTDQSYDEMCARRLGRCEDITNMISFGMRSVAAMCASDYTPWWAASDNNHAWEVVLDANGQGRAGLAGRAAKVYRKTFAHQPDSLAAVKRDDEAVPKWLSGSHYIDVTAQYQPSERRGGPAREGPRRRALRVPRRVQRRRAGGRSTGAGSSTGRRPSPRWAATSATCRCVHVAGRDEPAGAPFVLDVDGVMHALAATGPAHASLAATTTKPDITDPDTGVVKARTTVKARRVVRAVRLARRGVGLARAHRGFRRRPHLRGARGRRPLLARRGRARSGSSASSPSTREHRSSWRPGARRSSSTQTDLGLHPAVRRAVEECAARGTVTSASVLANGPDLGRCGRSPASRWARTSTSCAARRLVAGGGGALAGRTRTGLLPRRSRAARRARAARGVGPARRGAARVVAPGRAAARARARACRTSTARSTRAACRGSSRSPAPSRASTGSAWVRRSDERYGNRAHRCASAAPRDCRGRCARARGSATGGAPALDAVGGIAEQGAAVHAARRACTLARLGGGASGARRVIEVAAVRHPGRRIEAGDPALPAVVR
jgi:hypothetical protein